MGLLSDLFIANRSELQQLGEDLPVPRLRGEQFTGITPVHLELLAEVVGGVDTASAVSEVLRGNESDEGPWTSRLSAELTTRLASLSDAEVRNVASEWVTFEEDTRGIDVTDARHVLDTLRKLAREALGSGRELYHRVSL